MVFIGVVAIVLVVALLIVELTSTLVEKGKLAERNVALEQRLADTQAQVTYWQTRCELYIDRAAAKAGIAHEPVMTGERTLVDQLAQIPVFGGVGIDVVDSTKPGWKA